MSLSDLDFDELWIGYVGLGGSMTQADLIEVIGGQRLLSDHEHDVIAQALNDYFVGKGQDHLVPYSSELDEQPPEDDRTR